MECRTPEPAACRNVSGERSAARRGKPGCRAAARDVGSAPMKATAIILAAGEGKRMGMPKALLEYEKGKSFLRALATTFGKAGCDVLAVVGASAEDIRGNTPDVRIVENDAWREGGQLSSARAGLRAALDDGAEMIVVHPVDMPAVRTSTIKTLLTKADGADAVVPEFEGAAGHPLVLTRAGAAKILSAQGTA